nr:hypothetical protein A5866_001789 [Enterococcus sp. 12C11_DIV0727]
MDQQKKIGLASSGGPYTYFLDSKWTLLWSAVFYD